MPICRSLAVLSLVAKHSRVNFIAGPNVNGPVSLRIKLPTDKAFDAVIKIAGLQKRRVAKGIYWVRNPRSPAKKALELDIDLPEKIVSMEFSGAPVRPVLEVLAKWGGINISFGEGLEDPIWLRMDAVPVGDAIRAILKATGLMASQFRLGGSTILKVETPESFERGRSVKIKPIGR